MRGRRIAAVGVLLLLVIGLGVLVWLTTRGGGTAAPPAPRPAVEPHDDGADRRVREPAPEPPAPAAEANERATLRVRVRGPSGAAVAAADVSVWTGVPHSDVDIATATPHREGRAATGADGVADVAALPPFAEVTLVVTAARHARAVRMLTTPGRGVSLTVDVLLASACTLGGRVLSPDGTGIARAVVQIGRGFPWRAVTDGAGGYELLDLPWGRHEVRAGRAGMKPLRRADVILPLDGPLDIVLAEPAVLEGVVTDAETGTPLSGVRVVTGIWWGMQGGGEAVSGADGRYRIDTLPEGVLNQLTATRPGYKSPPRPPGPRGLQISVTAGQTTRRDIAMLRDAAEGAADASARIEGVVRGPAGVIAGVSVRLAGTQGRRRTTTAEDGSFAFAELTSGSWKVYALPRGLDLYDPAFMLGASRGDWSGASVDLGPGAVVTHDLTVLAGAAIVGRIVGADETPLAGARFGTAVTDAEGRFRLAGVAPGTSEEWYVWAPGHVRTTVRAAAPAEGDSDEVLVTLLPFARVRGSVRSESGDALPREVRARVVAHTGGVVAGPSGAEDLRVSTPVAVGTDGTFEAKLQWTTSGSFVVHLETPGLPTTRSDNIPISRGRDLYEIDMVLRDGVEVTGRVVDGATGSAVAGALVSLASRIDLVSAVTRQDGTFTARGDGSAPRVAVHVRAAGYLTWSSTVDSAAPEPVTARLVRVAEIRGRVVSEDGTPLAGVRVSRHGLHGLSTVTDHDGAFVLRDLHPGTVDLHFAPASADGPHVRSATVRDVAAGRDDLVVTLHPGLRIAGRVVFRGGGVADVDVQATPTGAPRGELAARAQTSGDGRFVLTGLAAGPHDLVAVPNRSSPYAREAAGAFPARAVGVNAGAGDVELVLTHGESIGGVVVDEGARPVGGLVFEAGGRTARSETDGTFEISGLPPGRYRIRVLPTSTPGAPAEVTGGEDVATGATGVRLIAREGLELVGSVTDTNGHGIAGAAVTLTSPRRVRRTVTTDEDGRFRIPGLARDAVTLTVTATDHVAERLTDHDPSTPATVRLGPALAAGGTLTDAAGAPIPDRWLDFVVEGADHLRREARTSADGSFRVDGLADRDYRVIALLTVDGHPTRIDVGSIRGGTDDVTLAAPPSDK